MQIYVEYSVARITLNIYYDGQNIYTCISVQNLMNNMGTFQDVLITGVNVQQNLKVDVLLMTSVFSRAVLRQRKPS